MMLVDTSALHRMARNGEIAERVAELRRTGSLWTCDIVTLELCFSARNRTEWELVLSAQRSLGQAPVDSGVTSRALEVQGELSRRGHHRVKPADLLIAAAAENAGLVVLHYDGDYDLIGRASGQETEWVVPRGSIP